jgi:hypothetical protein
MRKCACIRSSRERYTGRASRSLLVIKSELEGRPVYVWKESHIRAHFLICFIALTLIRVIQVKLNYTVFSAGTLTDALNSAVCTPLEKGVFVIDETDGAYKSIEAKFGVTLPNRYAPVEQLKAYRRKTIANS